MTREQLLELAEMEYEWQQLPYIEKVRHINSHIETWGNRRWPREWHTPNDEED